MCGSFLLMADVKELLKFFMIEQETFPEYVPGDFYPSKITPIVSYKRGKQALTLAKWGFALSDKKRSIINARSEAVMDKPMFKKSFMNHRCIIPANAFFEWRDEGGRKKVKYEIGIEGHSLICLGGIYKIPPVESSEEPLTFVILTTEAVGEVKAIHSRMPIILKKDQWDLWLDPNTPVHLLEKEMEPEALHRFSIKRSAKEVAPAADDWQSGQQNLFDLL